MKKIILFSIVIMIVLAGCANDMSLFEPIVGTWQNDGIGRTVLVFNNDETVVETYTVIGNIGVTRDGTWTSTSSSITRNWSTGTSDTNTYSFSSNNNDMTLESGGLSVTYTRQ